MRSVVEIGASVPAFLGKLWKLVNDTETNHLISWSPVCIFYFISYIKITLFMLLLSYKTLGHNTSRIPIRKSLRKQPKNVAS